MTEGYVPSIGSVPSSFSIAIYYGIVLGNFGFQQMPSAHGAHLVDFSVQQVNFINANSGTHFVRANSGQRRNFTSDFDGKGFFADWIVVMGSALVPVSLPAVPIIGATTTARRHQHFSPAS